MTLQGNIDTDSDNIIIDSASKEEAWTTAKIIELIAYLARAYAYVVDRQFGHTVIVLKYYERSGLFGASDSSSEINTPLLILNLVILGFPSNENSQNLEKSTHLCFDT